MGMGVGVGTGVAGRRGPEGRGAFERGASTCSSRGAWMYGTEMQMSWIPLAVVLPVCWLTLCELADSSSMVHANRAK